MSAQNSEGVIHLSLHYSERDSGHDLAFTGEGLIAEQSEAGATLFCIPQSER
jgi:glycerate kinase